MATTITWTEDEIARIRHLWLHGVPAQAIAAAFKHTREAICNLANREGWPLHDTGLGSVNHGRLLQRLDVLAERAAERKPLFREEPDWREEA